ncbi:dTDP-4-dehydrorhamnose 3,5-epimerase family protein [Modestobacter roseus]|uniref:dTDP-4-dehydrorhamnose 3,5-epimerase n=1 Tax=Modestobacter roseus TaxID=1181884 RepID=A0A562IX03_9ACTN|nr:dTDP-4-dehydrorhamnose 3,5-epimerase family protein [Modestobacter roseus]MQA34011.1 dTDP-4-dehydrorhamnose 3,5-epimerase [Modestobacter roseus]TWH75370.1 dTDP-4-dehydrorhamnose 3,5-epimerase [Modestobacter roseus]
MKYTPQAVDGVYLVDLEPHSDDRGFFARSYDTAEFAAHGMRPEVAQCNVSFNHRAGTLRGLHLSLPGHPEAKFIRCTRGAIVDVAVDVRPESPTYLQHVAVELTADNRSALYLPPHLAHAYQTLTDDTEVLYMVSVPYAPGAEMGFRYDDPAFGVSWPLPVSVISDKDAGWAPFDADANAERFAAGVPS